jgi:hypothetical protein
MKWNTYKQLDSERKEEYNYRFLNYKRDILLVMISNVIIASISIQVGIIPLAIFFLIIGILCNVGISFISFQEYRWRKNFIHFKKKGGLGNS